MAEGFEDESSNSASAVSLNLIVNEDKPTSHVFHLSEIKLVDLLAKKDNVDSTLIDDGSKRKSFVIPDIVVTTSHDNILDDKVAIYEDHFEDEEEEEEEEEEDEEDYLDDVPVDDYRERKKEDDGTALDKLKMSLIPSTASKLGKFPKKLTIISDALEDKENLEDHELSPYGYRQRSKTFETIPMTYGQYMSEMLMTRRRSTLMSRTGSKNESRLRMIEDFREVLENRRWLKLKNSFLHRKCCHIIGKSSAILPFETLDGALPIYVDMRYQNILEDFKVTATHYEASKSDMEDEIERLKNSYKTLSHIFEEIFEDFLRREFEIQSDYVDDKSGKKMTFKMVTYLTKKQRDKFQHLSRIRVYYLKLSNRLNVINSDLRRLNKMGEGRTLIDYEQLLIVNSSLMDKMDERDEELRKFREKCVGSVSILSHMKEASDVLKYDMTSASSILEKVTDKQIKARTLLLAEGMKRDSLRKQTSMMRNVVNLIDKPELLKKMIDNSRLLEIWRTKVQKVMTTKPSMVTVTPEKKN